MESVIFYIAKKGMRNVILLVEIGRLIVPMFFTCCVTDVDLLLFVFYLIYQEPY